MTVGAGGVVVIETKVEEEVGKANQNIFVTSKLMERRWKRKKGWLFTVVMVVYVRWWKWLFIMVTGVHRRWVLWFLVIGLVGGDGHFLNTTNKLAVRN